MASLLMVQAPSAVSVKTAGYTLPTNRVGRLTVNLEGSATFTIDGVTALRGTQNSVLASDNMSVAVTVTDGNINTYRPLITGTNTTGSSNALTGTAFSETTDQKTVIANVTVPPGTIINGTGTFRIIVEEYPA